MDSNYDYRPRLATNGAGTWVAVWDSYVFSGGALGDDLDILYARSTDDGQTWSAPAPLNSNTATDYHHDVSASVTTDGVGLWPA